MSVMTGLVERMPWRRAFVEGESLVFGGRPRRRGARTGAVSGATFVSRGSEFVTQGSMAGAGPSSKRMWQGRREQVLAEGERVVVGKLRGELARSGAEFSCPIGGV